jgi:hypothetical protein
MKKYKVIFIHFILFMLCLILTGYQENNFHRFVRYLYVTLTRYKIHFHSPKLDLYFFSFPFIISFGLYFNFSFYLLQKQSKKQKIVNTALIIILLVSSVLFNCYFDATIKLIECTACDDGTMELYYSDVSYSKIFIASLLISLTPLIWTAMRNKRETKTIGLNT